MLTPEAGDLDLAVRAAWLYYEDGLTQAQVASRLKDVCGPWVAKGAYDRLRQNRSNLGAQLPLMSADTSTRPGGAMKASRTRRPSAVRMGMFCRLGSLLLRRPVTATACA